MFFFVLHIMGFHEAWQMEMGFLVKDDALVWRFLFAHTKAELMVLGYVVLCGWAAYKSYKGTDEVSSS